MSTNTSTIDANKFDKICRTCLRTADLSINIFRYLLQDKLIANVLGTCASIQIDQNDCLPQRMCSKCIVSLSEVYDFVKKCQQSNDLLHSALKMLKEENSDADDYQMCFVVDLVEEPDEKNINLQEAEAETEEPPRTETPSLLREALESVEVQLATPKIVFKKKPKRKFRILLPSQPPLVKSKMKKRHAPGPPFCGRCKCSFQSVEELMEHRNTVHIKIGEFRCDLCPKVFSQKKHRETHRRIHTKEKPYICHICGRRFSISANLKRHNMIHTGERPYVCDICGKGFIQLVELQAHLMSHTGYRPYCCEFCNRSFKFMHMLTRHMARDHLHNLEDGGLDESKLSELVKEEVKCECPICNRPFKNNQSLQNHMKRHGEKKFLCDDCGKRFATKLALKIHLRMHTGEKPHKCTDCGKGFAQPSSLTYHRRTHTGERPFSCAICGKAFTQSAHLQTHMKTHTGERPFNCPYCNKAFALKKNMIVHSRMHTGERPWKCPVCGKGFYDSSSMKKHARGHHNTEVKAEIVQLDDEWTLEEYCTQ